MTRSTVVIVGAGPAGAVTAMLLARAGIDVRLLDRRAFPREKPCGDCLSPGATALLDRLGVSGAVRPLPAAVLRGWRVVAPDGSDFTMEGGRAQGGLAIERSILDAALLEAAIAAGAVFVPRCPVTDVLRAGARVTGVRTRAGDMEAAVTVGADGLRSVVAARLGAVRRRARALRKVSLTAHVHATLDHCDIGEMHVGDGLCAGVAAVTPDGARCNLTVVADADRFGRAIARDARLFMATALASLPRLCDRVDTTELNGSGILASGPFDRPVRRVAFDGAALVGDAAGYYDPFTGQGIFQAMASAELLANAILTAFRSRSADSARRQSPRGPSADELRPYAMARARLLRGPRLVQHGIELALSRPARANTAIRRLAHADAFADAVAGVTGDVAPASCLLSHRALFSLIRPPLQEIAS